MRRLAAVALAAALSIPSPARAHGARHGLHLHITPEAAAPGAVVDVAADAEAPVRQLKIGFVGETPLVIKPKKAVKRVLVKLAVPAATQGLTAGIQAEAVTATGKTLRSAGNVRVMK